MQLVGDDTDSGPNQPEREGAEKVYTETGAVLDTRPRRRRRKPRINKAEKIREAARSLVALGKPPRPVEIVDILAAKGIDVLSSQVSMALRGTGMELRPRQSRRQTTPTGLPDPATAIGQVSLDDLLLVREFIGKIGTLDTALAALIAYRQLGMEGIKQEGHG